MAMRHLTRLSLPPVVGIGDLALAAYVRASSRSNHSREREGRLAAANPGRAGRPGGWRAPGPAVGT